MTAPKWTDFADEVIRAKYPSTGAKGCANLLPDRTANAITKRAFALGVTCRESWGLSQIARQDFADDHRLWMACDVAMGADRRLAA